jgi:DDRGK domain-containing protein 1
MIIESVSLFVVSLVIGAVVYWLLRERKTEVPPPVPQRVANRMQLRREQNDDEENKEEVAEETKMLNRKDAAKQAKKEEKKKQVAARRAAIDEMNKAKDEKHQQWLKKEEILEQKEREEEERLKKIEEERLKKEEEEYAQWKDFLKVESTGEETQEEVFTLDKFIEYIKLRKVVMIEDLASAFNLDGKSTRNRIEELEKSGHLSGVLDDRGKYVYITQEEFLAFKKYIENRGRVSRMELCKEGNRLIRMNPTAEDKAKIEAEEKELLAKDEVITKDN